MSPHGTTMHVARSPPSFPHSPPFMLGNSQLYSRQLSVSPKLLGTAGVWEGLGLGQLA